MDIFIIPHFQGNIEKMELQILLISLMIKPPNMQINMDKQLKSIFNIIPMMLTTWYFGWIQTMMEKIFVMK
jgi:hypothetical protein